MKLTTHSNFKDVVSLALTYINLLILLLTGIAVVVFFWGLVMYIRSAGGEGKVEGRELITWGLLAVAVLFLLGGILVVVRESLIGGVSAPLAALHGY